MINTRQAGRRRGRGGQRQQNGRGTDNGNRIDNRARGNAAQLLEKYKTLARDAQQAGDRVLTEYYLQFADHYFRVLSESRSRYDDGQVARRGREEAVNGDPMDDSDELMDGDGDGQRPTPRGYASQRGGDRDAAPRREQRAPRRSGDNDRGGERSGDYEPNARSARSGERSSSRAGAEARSRTYGDEDEDFLARNGGANGYGAAGGGSSAPKFDDGREPARKPAMRRSTQRRDGRAAQPSAHFEAATDSTAPIADLAPFPATVREAFSRDDNDGRDHEPASQFDMADRLPPAIGLGLAAAEPVTSEEVPTPRRRGRPRKTTSETTLIG